jgi:hypothetical protein
MAGAVIIPTQVTVGPFRYEIQTNDNVRLDENEFYGDVNYKKHVITIHSDCAPSRQAEVLIHEVLHTLIDICGRPLPANREEQLVTVLGPVLLDTLQRNPDLVAYLMEPTP